MVPIPTVFPIGDKTQSSVVVEEANSLYYTIGRCLGLVPQPKANGGVEVARSTRYHLRKSRFSPIRWSL